MQFDDGKLKRKEVFVSEIDLIGRRRIQML